MTTAALPTKPAVAIQKNPIAATEEDMARIVPDWAIRLAREDGGSPWIRMSAFIRGGYLPLSRDVMYARANRYNRRVWRKLVEARRRGGLIDTRIFEPEAGELPCEVHEPSVKGVGIQISKRLFLRQMLGYLPIVPGAQP